LTLVSSISCEQAPNLGTNSIDFFGFHFACRIKNQRLLDGKEPVWPDEAVSGKATALKIRSGQRNGIAVGTCLTRDLAENQIVAS
jgi:hypothetical protein